MGRLPCLFALLGKRYEVIGFIGGFPIPDIVGPANAILLGAQSVRPDATCNIIFLNSWSDPGKEKEAALALISQGCDVICGMTDSPAAVQAAEQSGVFSTGYASDMSKFGPTRQLTAFTVDWSGIYTQDAKDVIAGTWKPQSRWQGLKEGVVKMAPYAAVIPPDVRALLAKAEDDIKSGALQPYGGEIKDQAGTVPGNTEPGDGEPAGSEAEDGELDGYDGWQDGPDDGGDDGSGGRNRLDRWITSLPIS